jgi:hypothetical protein
MKYFTNLSISLVCILLSSCASQKLIKLDGNAKIYSCLTPKYKTVIAMHWDTCPLLGWNPRHAMLNQIWEVVPIVSIQNEKYYKGQKSLQGKLNKEVRDCSWPSKISEIIELKNNSEINIDKMYNFYNPSAQGIFFIGKVRIHGKIYNVDFRRAMKKSTNVTGYNIDDYFESCDIDT